MVSGFPLGYRYVVNSSGILACAWGDQGIHQTLEGVEEGCTEDTLLDPYMVDISVNPGNSGGPCYRVTDQRVLGICEALQLVEVAFAGNGPDGDDASGRDDAALPIDDAQSAVLQKADIPFVIPAKYVVALLETV
jgi:hypothetical protein